MTERPIFVVGVPRSGTTLLQALLGSHPAIAAPPEVHFFLRVYGLRDYYGDLAGDDRLRLAVSDLVNDPSGLLASCGFDVDALVDRLRAGDRSYRSLLDGLLTDFAERQGKRRWSEKTPGQRAGQIWGLMPEALVVHIVRDPRAVAASRLRTPLIHWSARDVGNGWRAHTSDTIERGAQRGPEHYLRLRYEDLVTDTVTAMRGIGEFIGETFDEGTVTDLSGRGASVPTDTAAWQHRALEPVDASSAERWRTELAFTARAQIGATTAGLLRDLGYRPPSIAERTVGRILTLRPEHERPAPRLSPEQRHARLYGTAAQRKATP